MTQSNDNDIRVVVRKTYQSPMPRSRIRFNKADAYADWAHLLVLERLRYRCECEEGEPSVGVPFYTCIGHKGVEVQVMDIWGEPTDRTTQLHRGIFNAEVRHNMKRRLVKMLVAGWRPKPCE